MAILWRHKVAFGVDMFPIVFETVPARDPILPETVVPTCPWVPDTVLPVQLHGPRFCSCDLKRMEPLATQARTGGVCGGEIRPSAAKRDRLIRDRDRW